MTFLAERDLYRATPSVTRSLGVWCLIRRIAPICRLVRRAKDTEDQIEFPYPMVLRFAIQCTFVYLYMQSVLAFLTGCRHPWSLCDDQDWWVASRRWSSKRRYGCPTWIYRRPKTSEAKSWRYRPIINLVMTFVNNRPMPDRYIHRCTCIWWMYDRWNWHRTGYLRCYLKAPATARWP